MIMNRGEITLTEGLKAYISALIEKYPLLSGVESEIVDSYKVLEACFESGNKLLCCGNGGSSADSDHVATELMKQFVLVRPLGEELQAKIRSVDSQNGDYLAKSLQHGLPAFSLTSNSSIVTAMSNDCDFNLAFAQEIISLGRSGDVLLAISTSGNSASVVNAAAVAKAMGIKVIGLTGKTGGRLKEFCDTCILVPGSDTYQIQELHLPVYHCLCLMLEYHFWGENK